MTAAGDGRRGKSQDDDVPDVNRRVRKAIVGEEARRDNRDEKARNIRHPLTPPPPPVAAPERSRAAARRTTEAAVAADTSKEGNDDSRRRVGRRKGEAEEERKTPTNEHSSRGRPSEGSRGAREGEGRWTKTRNHSVEAVAAAMDAAKNFDGDATDEFWKMRRVDDLLPLLRLPRSTSWRSSFVPQCSRMKIRCNETCKG